MRLRLLLLCVALLAILLLACLGRFVTGEVINKYQKDGWEGGNFTIKLEGGRTIKIGVNGEVYNSVSVGQSCTFYSDSKYVDFSKVFSCN